MGKQASDKTLLVQERRLTRRLRKEMMEVQSSMDSYRRRATRAEQDASEWKARFDALLVRTPPVSASAEPK